MRDPVRQHTYRYHSIKLSFPSQTLLTWMVFWFSFIFLCKIIYLYVYLKNLLIFSRTCASISISLYFLNFSFCIRVQLINNVVIVSGGPWRGPAIYIHVSSPLDSLPTQAATYTEQSSMCSTLDTCWLPFFKYSSVMCMPIPNCLSFPLSFPLATISLLSKAVGLFLFCKFIYTILF